MKAALLPAAALAALTGATAAYAQAGPATDARTAGCDLQIEAPTGDWIIRGYDPLGNAAPIGTYDLMFVNNGNQECRFYPAFQTDGAVLGLTSRSDTGHVPYSLFDTYGHYDATPIGGRTLRNTTHRPVVVAARSQQLVRYVMTIANSAIPGDGLFSQRLIVDAEGIDREPLAERQVVLGVDVLPSAVMELAGAFRRDHGQAEIDLGELVEGVPAIPLQLQVRSTRRYKLQLSSLNQGALRLAGTRWTVPYQVTIDGRQLPFGAARPFGSASRWGLQTDDLPVAFHIGNVDDRRAGTYSDTITVTISVD